MESKKLANLSLFLPLSERKLLRSFPRNIDTLLLLQQKQCEGQCLNVSTTLIRQWGAGNVYLLVLSSWKVNIAENPIAVMGL